MRKISAVLGTMLLTFFLASPVMAQFNQNAYFLLDWDLATKGFVTSTTPILNIGPTTKVGFKVYSQAWDDAKGWTVHFEWDSTKAEFMKTNAGPGAFNDVLTVNGASITPPAEDNIIGNSVLSAGEINTPGVYEISYAQQGTVAAAKNPVGLVYFAVLRTLATFKTTDALTVAASVTVVDETAKTRFLGTRYFKVNQAIDVKNSSWGAVKKQFKDF
jgi:hypothetical protein